MTPATAKLSFPTRDSPFKRELYARVEAHFAGRSRNATAALWVKAVFWLVAVFGTWGLLTFIALPGWLAVVLSLGAGFSATQVGFNVGHDAIHGSLSKRPWVNAIFARTFDVMGSSSRMWIPAHNVTHHTYTNVPGTDHDLDPGPFMHFYPHRQRSWVHGFQHVYAWALYTLTQFVWVFKKDFVDLVARGDKTTKRDVIDVVVSKVLHLFMWVGVPMLVGTVAWWQVLIGYALMLAASGFTSAVVFQLAHVVEGPAFPKPNAAGVLGDDFLTHQLKTTSNFAPGNPVATFFTGGLNHQVEHHLFPRISHIHYPALAPIVEDCALKHGLPYYAHATFHGALASHARTLKRLGHSEPEPLLPLGRVVLGT